MTRRMLLCVAAQSEARAVLAGLGADPALAAVEWTLADASSPGDQGAGVDLVVTGVGKSNAAGATARVLDPARHGWVVSLGIGGALPGSGLTLSDVVVASACVLADEGVQTDGGFSDIGAMGFPPLPGLGVSIPTDAGIRACLSRVAGREGAIATVSTCSGTDARAGEVARRSGAIVEAMEGAAVAVAARRLGVPMGEVRVVSNTTGSRTGQRWDLRGSLARLSDVARELPRMLTLRPVRGGEG